MNLLDRIPPAYIIAMLAAALWGIAGGICWAAWQVMQ